jgi:microcystin-dependent protein
MADPFLGEIKIMSFNFAPKGWAMCNGQFLPINQNQALFALLGTTYGGNGQTTFALPNLRTRVPIHRGKHTLGQAGGEHAHTVIAAELPAHTHVAQGSSLNANQPSPLNNILASANNAYASPANLVAISPTTVTNAGGSQPHENKQPYLTLTFCIALQGIIPSPN